MENSLFAACVSILSANAFTGTTKITGQTYLKDNVIESTIATPEVLAGFHTYFGEVPVRRWMAIDNGQWVARFMRNGVVWEVTFSSTGTIIICKV